MFSNMFRGSGRFAIIATFAAILGSAPGCDDSNIDNAENIQINNNADPNPADEIVAEDFAVDGRIDKQALYDALNDKVIVEEDKFADPDAAFAQRVIENLNDDSRLRQILETHADLSTFQFVDGEITDPDAQFAIRILDSVDDEFYGDHLDLTTDVNNGSRRKCKGKHTHETASGSYGGKPGTFHIYKTCGRLTLLKHCPTGGGGCKEI